MKLEQLVYSCTGKVIHNEKLWFIGENKKIPF